MTEDERLDIDALEKTTRLHDLQFGQLQAVINEANGKIIEFMRITNKTLKLHEQGIGLMAARIKRLEEAFRTFQSISSATSDASDATVES